MSLGLETEIKAAMMVPYVFICLTAVTTRQEAKIEIYLTAFTLFQI